MTLTLEQRIANLSPEKRAMLELYITQKQRDSAKPASHIPRCDPTQPLPLSFAQQRLWFLQQFQPHAVAYNNVTALRLTGPLHVAALQQSLDELLRRHESLRTTFLLVNEEPQQVINPPVSFPLPVEDLAHVPVQQRAATIEAHILAEGAIPFDLTRDLMRRGRLLRFTEQEHVLLIVSHHIASDGWSSGIFWRELQTLYTAFIQDQLSPLPELPIQYADYTVWQRQSLQGERLATLLGYWQRQLAGIPELLSLPTDYPRPAEQESTGATWRFTISKPLADALKSVARQDEATPFMLLLATFQVLLARYTGQTDIVVGTPIAGRQHPELEGLIGIFINTLVMRTNLAGNPTFRLLLQQVRNNVFAAFTHQELPFERLVEALQPPRSLSHHPLFQVMFILQNTPKTTIKLPGLQVERLARHGEAAKFDLTLALTESADGLVGELEYDTALFAPTTIERIATHYCQLLEAVVADPDCPIGTLPMLSAAERQQLLIEWSNPESAGPKAKYFQQLFEEQVERQPNAVAAVFNGESITYQALNGRANQLARYLQNLGIGPETLVGLFVERSLTMLIGLLGILKAGGAYVPIDPLCPETRLAWLCTATQPRVMLTQRTLSPRLPPMPAPIICLDSDWPEIAKQATQNPPQTTTSEQLAYVLYTSGSTGQPKGVQIEHGALASFLQAVQRALGFGAHDTLLAVTTITFDIAGLELFSPLVVGARVVIADQRTTQDGKALQRLLQSVGATLMQATPATWHMLLNSGWQPTPPLKILVGGEALSHILANQLVAAGNPVWNLYGPTEATIWATAYRIDKASTAQLPQSSIVTIGRPLANNQIYILDTHMQPVPCGVAGELYIGGRQVARGYLNQPQLTATRFIANPFGAGRLYKTGDSARYLPDQHIEFLGRLDQQVKLRGFRIELGEIESTLDQHPAVQQSIVMLAGQTPTDQHLIAYWVAKPTMTATTPELREWLSARLPAYMLPSRLVACATLPLTPNGKVDRLALSSIAVPPIEPERQSGKAQDALERQLTQIWEKILKRRSIGVHDSFFDLGGHSLLAVQLFEQMAKVTGQELPLSVLFQAPTIAQLATILHQQNWQPTWRSLTPIQAHGHKPPLFMAAPAGSTVLRFAGITRHLPADQPVYGLEYLGMDGKSEPQTSIEEMAAYHVTEMRKLQPNPPYLLAGFCFGAHVLFEVAQQLNAQGLPVALLAVLDAGPPAYGPTWQRASQAQHFTTGHLQRMLNFWRTRGFAAWVQWHIAQRKRRLRDPFPQVYAAHMQASVNYHAKAYAGRIYLLQSTDYANIKEVRERWQSLTQADFVSDVIPKSTHLTIYRKEPYTRLLAEKLNAQIQQALAPFTL